LVALLRNARSQCAARSFLLSRVIALNGGRSAETDLNVMDKAGAQRTLHINLKAI